MQGRLSALRVAMTSAGHWSPALNFRSSRASFRLSLSAVIARSSRLRARSSIFASSALSLVSPSVVSSSSSFAPLPPFRFTGGSLFIAASIFGSFTFPSSFGFNGSCAICRQRSGASAAHAGEPMRDVGRGPEDAVHGYANGSGDKKRCQHAMLLCVHDDFGDGTRTANGGDDGGIKSPWCRTGAVGLTHRRGRSSRDCAAVVRPVHAVIRDDGLCGGADIAAASDDELEYLVGGRDDRIKRAANAEVDHVAAGRQVRSLTAGLRCANWTGYGISAAQNIGC